MSYFDGFVLAVPTAHKDKFIAHATLGDAVFQDEGALRIVEAWGVTMCPKASSPIFRARCRQRTTRRSSSRGSNGPTRPTVTM